LKLQNCHYYCVLKDGPVVVVCSGVPSEVPALE
jgi:hypothetical protein